MVARLVLLVLLVLNANCARAQSMKVVGVTDGDTVTVVDKDKHQVKVRLWGIDAPEKKQAFGSRSKEALSSKVFGKEIDLEEKSKDWYGRTVANVYLGGRWINKELVEEGMVWHYKQYAKKSSELAEAERLAKENKLGLWSDKNPVPPWEFRRKK
jgi:endonuclease YncB( thermonuclease family)